MPNRNALHVHACAVAGKAIRRIANLFDEQCVSVPSVRWLQAPAASMRDHGHHEQPEVQPFLDIENFKVVRALRGLGGLAGLCSRRSLP